MTLFNCFLSAIMAIRLNALRSILTTLGIIIGVASVIVMAAIGAGARQAVDEQIQALGSTMLSVAPGSSFSRGRSSGANAAPPLSERDLTALQNSLDNVINMTGELGSNGTAVNGNNDWPTSIRGTHASFPEVRNWAVAEGRFFTEREVTSGTRSAVIGKTLVTELFEGTDPVGAQLRVNNIPFEIIGVLSEKGQNSFGSDQDDIIIAPISVVRARMTGRDATVPDQISSIRILFREGTDLSRAQDEIREVMRVQRRIRPNAEDNFRIYNIAEFIRARNETSQTFSFLLAATAAISLLVGGIGIMNIMLVSVTERTREIGLRMAIGARRKDIMSQFLIEAILLCLVGGVIGLALGIGGARLAAQLGDWDVLIDASLVGIAIVASVVVGIIFGFFPARQAAKLNPIDALRYE